MSNLVARVISSVCKRLLFCKILHPTRCIAVCSSAQKSHLKAIGLSPVTEAEVFSDTVQRDIKANLELSSMKLFTDKGNYALLKILTAAKISKINLEVEFVSPESFKRPSIFPKAQLPFLELDGGSQLFTPNNICCYLLESKEGSLLCNEGDRPKVDELLEWDITTVQPVALPYVIAKATESKADPHLINAVDQMLAVLSKIVEHKQYCIGNCTTVADIVLWGTLYGVLHDNPEFQDATNKYPGVHSWFKNLSSKDEFKAASDAVIGCQGLTALKDSFHASSLPLNLHRSSGQSTSSQRNASPETPLEEAQEGPSSAEVIDAKKAWSKGRSAIREAKERKHPILPAATERNILITSALPYVNNVPHLGNIIGCVLSADVYSRYCRLRGYNSLYICGTDEYGTATETKAVEEGVTPQEICNKYNKIHQDVYKWFNIEFDYFGRTTTEQQTRIAQDIFWKLEKNGHLLQDTIDQLHCENCKKFLADRFVEGTCPYCAYEDARGDQCDACGKLINAVELKSPRCKVCSSNPVIKSTRHVFLDLPKIEPQLKSWLEKTFHKGQWTNNAIRITKGWLQEGLRARCITRDLKWGTPVPLEGFTDKVFYVWFDAPIGYLSITANYTDEWEKWWKNPDQVNLIQFMAKDNVPFHTVVFPCSLLGADDNYTLLNDISATEYLNYEDDKFSKSRGVGVFGDNAADTGIPADIYRFYLLYVRPENQDSAFSWIDFATRNNSELLNNLGNFVNRALTFLKNNFQSVVPNLNLNDQDFETVALVNRELASYVDNLEKIRLRDGIRNILTISKLGNQYMQSNKPWVLVKGSDEERARAGSVLGLACNIAALLCQLTAPYMPVISKEIGNQVQLPSEYNVVPDVFVPLLSAGHCIGTPKPLFQKIEIPVVEKLRERFSGGQSKLKKKPEDKDTNPKQNGPVKGTPTSDASVSDLEAAVTKQGDVVRKAKTDKADKAVIDTEVAKLLELKKQLALIKGEDPNAAKGKEKKKGKKK